MPSVALPDAARARRAFLSRAAGRDRSARAAAALLLGDALAAIGFAASLAGAIAAIAADRPLWPWVLLALAAGLARAVCAAGALGCGATAGTLATAALRREAIDTATRQPIGGERMAGALAAAVVDEAAAIGGYVARFLPARQAAGVAPLLVLGAVALASPVAALILGGTLVPFVAAMILAGGAAADQSRRQFAVSARLSGLFADRLQALPLLLAYRATARERVRLEASAAELADRTLSVLKVAFVSAGALEFFAALSVALVAVYAGFNLLGLLPFTPPERLDLARAFFVLALAPEFYLPMRRLAVAYHDKQAAETAADRLMKLNETRIELAPCIIARPPEITFADVAIRYPGSDVDAVARVSFTARRGEIVALVGPSGSGKSSLLRALLGMAPVVAGTVAIDGRVLRPGETVADGTAWAGQAPLLVAGSIADNLALARPGATRAEIERAADVAGLAPALAGRPSGLDTILDGRGGGLSGGERRRLGLARALLKDAPLLLLDEPTAHLDGAAETELIAQLRRACAGRTVLIATHSEALLAIADRVIDLGELS